MEKTDVRRRRVTVKAKSQNPLFEKWLQEWKDEAASRNSEMQYCFSKALTSLRKCPLILKSGKECAILKNFGTRLCVMLDRKLTEYKREHPNGIPEPLFGTEMMNSPISTNNRCKEKTNNKEPDKLKKARKTTNRSYIPTYRSGPYALLLTLLSKLDLPGYPGFMTKNELQIEAQPLSDTSLKKPDQGQHYSAWSSMGTLIKKGLVTKHSCPAKYSLTESGIELAKKLQSLEVEKPENTTSSYCLKPGSYSSSISSNTLETNCITLSPPKIYPSSSLNDNINRIENKDPVPSKRSKKTAATTANSSNDTVILTAGSFNVLLLVDTQESAGAAARKANDDITASELRNLGVEFEVRHLKVGDFLWICRQHSTGYEVVLPYIVERKRMDDLGKSIKDGRFHEQKFRLKRCGIPNCIYLVESYGKNDTHLGLPLSTLRQAATNTQVVDDFTIKQTSNHRESMQYLAVLTSVLKNHFKTKTIVSCKKDNLPEYCITDDLISLMAFQEFNQAAKKSKSLKVQELFLKQLVQLRGMSVEKAIAITKRYPTPRMLLDAFANGDENLLANIPHGKLHRLIGPVLSKAVYKLYTSCHLD